MMLTEVERARLVHQFISTAVDSPHGSSLVGAQVVGDEIVAFVRAGVDDFSGTFGEFKVRSVVTGEVEVIEGLLTEGVTS